MSYTALLEMKFKEDRLEAVKDAMSRILPESRQFDGCEGMTAHQSADDPTVVVVLERWASDEQQAAYSAYRQKQMADGPCDTATVISSLAAPPSMRRLEDFAV